MQMLKGKCETAHQILHQICILDILCINHQVSVQTSDSDMAVDVV